MTSEKFLTTQELAKVFNVSKKTLEHWRYNGEGPPWHKIGRSIRYMESEVDQWRRDQRMKRSSAS